MVAFEEAREMTEMTIEEATEVVTIEDAPESIGIVVEIPKPSCMPRSKKDKQPIIPMRVSPNLST